MANSCRARGLAGEIWPNKLFRHSFLGCWLLESTDDSVHPTARCRSAENIWWQFDHSHMRKSGDKALADFSMATWLSPLIKDGRCVGLAKNRRRASQNRPAFENDGQLD